jgi:hypothetical protein
VRDPLNDQLLKCDCPDCGASLRDQARYWEYEANESWPHTITARCDACQTEHKFRLKPVGRYYECLLIPEATEQGFTERG